MTLYYCTLEDISYDIKKDDLSPFVLPRSHHDWHPFTLQIMLVSQTFLQSVIVTLSDCIAGLISLWSAADMSRWQWRILSRVNEEGCKKVGNIWWRIAWVYVCHALRFISALLCVIKSLLRNLNMHWQTAVGNQGLLTQSFKSTSWSYRVTMPKFSMMITYGWNLPESGWSNYSVRNGQSYSFFQYPLYNHKSQCFRVWPHVLQPIHFLHSWSKAITSKWLSSVEHHNGNPPES